MGPAKTHMELVEFPKIHGESVECMLNHLKGSGFTLFYHGKNHLPGS